MSWAIMTAKLSPTEIYRDRKIFLIGGTGFLAKVTLSMLLYRFPNIGRVYVTVRARSQEESEARFWNNVLTEPPFDPLRERYGGALDGFIRDKVEVVGGDIAENNLGFSDEEAQRIAGDLDVIINSAGNVTFNPTLESGLRTNVVGTQNVIAFTKRMKRPCLVHISTCFVAGNRSGAVWENDDVIGYFPRKNELKGVEFSVKQEIADCAKMSERAREEAKDAMRVAQFRELARKRLNEELRDADDPDALGLAVARERKVWTRNRLTELGIERAEFWGWPNIYTYTKVLGEQLVAAETGIVRSIVRPSIVESAKDYPFPGWNEGFTTTAPIIFMTLKGQRQIPANPNLVLDITPVDQVAAVMLAVAAQACIEEPKLVHQAATGDSNPNNMERIISLVGLFRRQQELEKKDGLRLFREISARFEPFRVSPERFDATSLPMMNNAAKKVSSLLDKAKPRWGGGRYEAVINRMKQTVDHVEEQTREAKEAFEMFLPFTAENAYIFRSDNVRELATRAAAFFASQGIKSGDRVMLFSHNAPEWGMTYFGVLKAGATCIPIDAESSTNEVVNFARAGEASGIVISAKLKDEHSDLRAKLNAAGFEQVRLWTFDEVFELTDEKVEDERIALLPQRMAAQSVASLIFTSGTTGRPKGVMLSHRNLTSMVAMLASVFDMDTSDGVLSVLPLHHTFEFSTGFLTPLSRGAQITYLPELSSEHLAKAIKNGHVTGMVGVPALWELLHRRIKNRLHERNKWVGETADLLMRFNAWLRDKTPLNFGQLLFYPIHEGMGGRIRYFISGGSALNEKVQRDFQGLGFTILEGYGLTEASPVLTVTRPENRMLAGTVGKSLPGVEIRIAEPDAAGVGEVIARGPNVMVGYYGNEEATRQTLVDRWLYTGDLGRLDDEGNLYLVGRSKDIIVDTNGKNVYPDEVEEVYQDSPYIKELSVIGLPDGIGEKVACIVVPDEEYDIALSRAEVRQKIEEHFREVSATLPYYKRVKLLQFTDEELPRTATRKVKRREILNMMQKIQEGARSSQEVSGEEITGDAAWLIDIIASVSNRSLDEVSINSRLPDLGFDSLMFVELATAIENAGGALSAPERLNEVQDVRELLSVVNRQGTQRREATRLRLDSEKSDDEIHIPEFLRTVGNKGVDLMQRALYERLLRTKYEGR